MLTPSLPTEAPAGLSAAAWRRIQAGMAVRSAAGVSRVGVVPFSTDPIVTGTADLGMTYQIAPFVAVTARNSAGVEWVANDAITTVATTAAPGSNSRIDVIWVRCLFPLASDTGTAPLFGVTQGVANASPSKPSIPAGALELATAVVTSGDLTTQTVVITQTAPFTAMAGGTVWLRNQAEMDAWTPADGATAYRLDLDVLAVRENGIWAFEETRTVPYAESFYADHGLYESLRLRRRGTRGGLRGAFTTTSLTNFSATTLYTVGNVPVGWRPAAGSDGFCPIVFSGTTTVWGWARVTSAGLFQIWLSSAAASNSGADGMVVLVDMEWTRAV
ncbi:hypothetical protein [Microbacterium sp. 5K110]|uniref:hypothetical protein n=1 Tax=Microbacterium sp. 5K110 TaxID=2578104 RepID=UPI0010FE7CF7|nr:hypothetical protein [Microbacterium sp. 5K110]TLF33223.1 hypothetical protein FE256_03770 [Microbacterium sp. 5K110]